MIGLVPRDGVGVRCQRQLDGEQKDESHHSCNDPQPAMIALRFSHCSTSQETKNWARGLTEPSSSPHRSNRKLLLRHRKFRMQTSRRVLSSPHIKLRRLEDPLLILRSPVLQFVFTERKLKRFR